jgi:uncharacterized protein
MGSHPDRNCQLGIKWPVMTDDPTIDYEALELQAKRSIVRAVLERVAKQGLPGGHHFYVAFNTQLPGVILSKRLKERYPQDMTIVLQHRFWDLAVTEDRFEVKLTFESIPERLVVPFAAIRQFYDPSVPYGMQFDDLMPVDDQRGQPQRRPAQARRNGRDEDRPAPAARTRREQDAGDVIALTAVAPTPPTPIRADVVTADEDAPKRKPQRRTRAEADGSEAPASRAEPAAEKAPRESEAVRPQVVAAKPEAEATDEAPAANVVSLDKFRKK